jgi:hypothetical protein
MLYCAYPDVNKEVVGFDRSFSVCKYNHHSQVQHDEEFYTVFSYIPGFI